MNEAETFIALAIGGKPFADHTHGSGEKFLLCAINPHTVAPAAPVGFCLAQTGFKIPRKAREKTGPLPRARMAMHAGRNFTQNFKGFGEILPNARLGPGFPIRQHSIAAGNFLNDFAVAALHRLRRHHNRLASQIHEPGKFGSDGSLAVIAFTMQPQRPFATIPRLNFVGGVFGKIDHGDGNIGGQGIVRHRFFCDLLGDIRH